MRGLRRRSTAARLLRLWVRIPPGGMDVCLLGVLCVVRYRSLRRIDHSSGGVLPTVARRCVWSGNLENEEAKARYRAVKIQPQWVVTPGKQTTNNLTLNFVVYSLIVGTSRSACRTSLDIYHGVLTIDWRTLFWYLCNIPMFELLAVPRRGCVNMAYDSITRMDTFTFATAMCL